MRETGKPPRGGNYGIVREVRNENVVFKALAKTVLEVVLQVFPTGRRPFLVTN